MVHRLLLVGLVAVPWGCGADIKTRRSSSPASSGNFAGDGQAGEGDQSGMPSNGTATDDEIPSDDQSDTTDGGTKPDGDKPFSTAAGSSTLQGSIHGQTFTIKSGFACVSPTTSNFSLNMFSTAFDDWGVLGSNCTYSLRQPQWDELTDKREILLSFNPDGSVLGGLYWDTTRAAGSLPIGGAEVAFSAVTITPDRLTGTLSIVGLDYSLQGTIDLVKSPYPTQ